MADQPIPDVSPETLHPTPAETSTETSTETSASHLATLLRIVEMASLSKEARVLRESGLSWGVFGSDTQEWRSDQPLEIRIGKLMKAAGAGKGPLRGVGMSRYTKKKICTHARGAYLGGGRAWIGMEIHPHDPKPRMTLVGIKNETDVQAVSSHNRMGVELLFREVQDATLRSVAVERLLRIRHGDLRDVSYAAKDLDSRNLPTDAALDAKRAEQEADIIKVVAYFDHIIAAHCLSPSADIPFTTTWKRGGQETGR